MSKYPLHSLMHKHLDIQAKLLVMDEDTELLDRLTERLSVGQRPSTLLLDAIRDTVTRLNRNAALVVDDGRQFSRQFENERRNLAHRLNQQAT